MPDHGNIFFKSLHSKLHIILAFLSTYFCYASKDKSYAPRKDKTTYNLEQMEAVQHSYTINNSIKYWEGLAACTDQ